MFLKVQPNKQRNVGPITESGTGASESAPVTRSMSCTLLYIEQDINNKLIKGYNYVHLF